MLQGMGKRLSALEQGGNDVDVVDESLEMHIPKRPKATGKKPSKKLVRPGKKSIGAKMGTVSVEPGRTPKIITGDNDDDKESDALLIGSKVPNKGGKRIAPRPKLKKVKARCVVCNQWDKKLADGYAVYYDRTSKCWCFVHPECSKFT
jgi:hypothetical protein